MMAARSMLKATNAVNERPPQRHFGLAGRDANDGNNASSGNWKWLDDDLRRILRDLISLVCDFVHARCWSSHTFCSLYNDASNAATEPLHAYYTCAYSVLLYSTHFCIVQKWNSSFSTTAWHFGNSRVAPTTGPRGTNQDTLWTNRCVWNVYWCRAVRRRERMSSDGTTHAIQVHHNQRRWVKHTTCMYTICRQEQSFHSFIVCRFSYVEEEISTSISYKSCSRTEADEEFLMVRAHIISLSSRGLFFFKGHNT